MNRNSFALLAALVFSVGAEAHEHNHDDEHALDHSKSVEVSSDVRRALGLKCVRPEKRRLSGMTVLTGRYELSPEARRSAVSPVAGRLSLGVKPFSKVSKGDILFKVAAPDLVSSADEIALLEKRLEVYRKLNTPNASLENELAVKKASRAALLAGAEESNGEVIVRASADGVVETLSVTDEAWVEVGTEVVRLVNPKELRLKTLVSAPELAAIEDGCMCDAEGVKGVVRIGLDSEGGLIPVYAVFPGGTARGRVGSRGTFSCEREEAELSVCVPRSAIVRLGLAKVVFVRDEHDENRFLAVEVIPGLVAGEWTSVEGLPDDDDLEIVSEGAYELKLALSSDVAKPSGHFHADGTFHDGEDD